MSVIMYYTITWCAQNLTENPSELPRQESFKPYVFKHEWIHDEIGFCSKTHVWWLTLQEGKGMFLLAQSQQVRQVCYNTCYTIQKGSNNRTCLLSRTRTINKAGTTSADIMVSERVE